MKTFRIKKGLDIPIAGAPKSEIRQGNRVSQVALVGDDYIGMKPTMSVQVGDKVACGTVLFSDKKNKGVVFTSPAGGTVVSINRGAKRKFESIVIDIDHNQEEKLAFSKPLSSPDSLPADKIRALLIDSGLWTSLRTRPYGKTPEIDSTPASLFITAVDSSPLAASPQAIIDLYQKEYHFGLLVLRNLINEPIHYCLGERELLSCEKIDNIQYSSFIGPHPSGLPSTHIHFLDPVHENKTVWHIGYQDVINIGYLFLTGELLTEKIIALSGSGFTKPSLIKTRFGASITNLCEQELPPDKLRIVSGCALSGREAVGNYTFLGKFDNQVTAIEDSSGRSLFNWALPGCNRFSCRPVFASAWLKEKLLPMNTALWGGKRAIYPLGTYDQVMPLDIIATALLRTLSSNNSEKAKNLGCLELIEEDLGLCGFVCPGKNEFGPLLREMLTTIELGG